MPKLSPMQKLGVQGDSKTPSWPDSETLDFAIPMQVVDWKGPYLPIIRMLYHWPESSEWMAWHANSSRISFSKAQQDWARDRMLICYSCVPVLTTPAGMCFWVLEWCLRQQSVLSSWNFTICATLHRKWSESGGGYQWRRAIQWLHCCLHSVLVCSSYSRFLFSTYWDWKKDTKIGLCKLSHL